MRDEKGAAMLLAVILLLVAGLVVASLLSFMGTGFVVGPVYEGRVAELYGADAGVEDAVWKIQRGVAKLCPGDPDWPPYSINVNKRTVEINISSFYGVGNVTTIYRVISTATGGDSGTQVEAYVTAVTRSSGILDHVITSPCGYNVSGGRSQINPPDGEHGPEGDYEGTWPTAEMLSDLYWEDVEDALPYYTANELNVEEYTTSGIGPLYRDGTLDIKAGGKGLTVTLDGTVYITGDTLIGTTGVGKDFTIDLNGQTIFVNSTSGAAPADEPCNPGNGYALKIGAACTFTGSGCIIAVGNIEFKPNLNCSQEDYILVLSVSGKTYMQPNGDFYGTLAGNADVYIQNGDATWTDYSTVEGGLNFPSLAGVQEVSCSIASWQVTPLAPSEQ